MNIPSRSLDVYVSKIAVTRINDPNDIVFSRMTPQRDSHRGPRRTSTKQRVQVLWDWNRMCLNLGIFDPSIANFFIIVVAKDNDVVISI